MKNKINIFENTEYDCSELTLEQYELFLKSKLSMHFNIKGRKIQCQNSSNAITNEFDCKEDHLFDYQKFILEVAFNKKRYAIFADCGLGKTAIFLAWIKRIEQLIDKKILIISPLCVIQQTINEEEKFYGTKTIFNAYNTGLKSWLESSHKIGIINYDKFKEEYYLQDKVGAVVIDESSILKNETGKIRTSLIKSTYGIPYKLCCSATPAPNDRMEYANHSTFLEYSRSNNEFFSMFFVNTDKGWIIKEHAMDYFYKHLSEWSIFIRNAKNYGFGDNLKNIPVPEFHIEHVNYTQDQLNVINKNCFINEKQEALTKRLHYSQISKGFYVNDDKINYIETNKYKRIKEIVEKEKNKQIIIWCIFNEEEKLLINALSSESVCHITGKTTPEERNEILENFKNKKYRILITKPKLMGFGINLQNVTVHIFSGLSDSYEQFYQSIRRSYRYGAIETLHVYIPVTKSEQIIYENVLRKKNTFEIDSFRQESSFIKHLNNQTQDFIKGDKISFLDKNVGDKKMKVVDKENWKLILGDSIKILRSMEVESIDFSIFSPPFASLYTYSSEIGDMGNSRNGYEEFKLHMEFFLKGLFQVIKTGRLVCCHLSQLPTFKSLEGYVGTKDFRGIVIELFQTAGFIYFGEWCIRKNPQAQAIREKVRSLSFAQLDRNRLGSKAGFNDFILVFKKPGDPKDEVNDDSGPSRDEWINWATGVWTDIKESDTLNVRGTKGKDDVKHICPLQLEVIRRCIRLYTNKNELVFDPFNGIGSTGVISLEQGRKYLGIELKEEYFDVSINNLEAANRIKDLKITGYNIKNTDTKSQQLSHWWS